MRERFGTVSEREKETLRLLLSGHDAKSIALTLGLSIHTVNERLREARRKLGVGSSREAARLLAQMESQGPNFLGDKQIGVVATEAPGGERDPSENRQRVGHAFAWFSGGVAIMFAIVVSVAISLALQDDGRTRPPTTPIAVSASSSASDQAGAHAAEEWAKLIDGQRWGESWKASGSLFRAQVTEAGWTATVQPLRQQLGAVASRSLKSVSSASSLPGAPAGEYKIVQFATVFANRPDAVETLILAHEGSAWKVNGYFIR
jgi:DNA-binding CsgD family transcriptional regulator